MNPLFIVESHDKRISFERILPLLFAKYEIIITQGKLLDVSWHSAYLDSGEYVPVKPAIYHSIVQSIKRSNHVFIASDPDEQGEVIAYDLVKLCKDQSRDWSRVRCYDFTEKSLICAIESSTTKLKCREANKGRLYGLYDFLISKSLSIPSKGIIIGRCMTPLLGIFDRRNSSSYSITQRAEGFIKQFFSSYPSVSAEPTLDTAQSKVNASLPGVSLSKLAIEFATKHPQANLLELNATLQRNYLNGEISYFRSETQQLTSQDLSRLRRTYLDAGWLWHPKEMGKANYLSPHGSILLCSKDSKPRTSLDKWVMDFLEQHYDRVAGSIYEEIIEEKPSSWRKLVSVLNNTENLKSETHCCRLNKKASVIATLSEFGLSAPSTILSIAEKCSLFIDDYHQQYILNRRGQQSVHHLANTFPELLHTEFHQKISKLFDLDGQYDRKELTDIIKTIGKEILPDSVANTFALKRSLITKPNSLHASKKENHTDT